MLKSLYNCIDFRSELTQQTFGSLCTDLFTEAAKPVREMLSEAQPKLTDHTPSSIELVLAGGMSHVPALRKAVVQAVMMDGYNVRECDWLNADEAAVYGAAVQAGKGI